MRPRISITVRWGTPAIVKAEAASWRGSWKVSPWRPTARQYRAKSRETTLDGGEGEGEPLDPGGGPGPPVDVPGFEPD